MSGIWHSRHAPAEATLPGVRLDGQTIVVTGVTAGIGTATAVALAAMGAQVIGTARNPEKGAVALEEIRQRSGSDLVEIRPLDLASLVSVRSFADSLLADLDHLDVLVNNAGALNGDRHETAEGFELTFGANHLGPFVLTQALLPLLEAAPAGRVVTVSSAAHRLGWGLRWDDLQATKGRYRAARAYGRSKLANLWFTTELARRLEGTSVTANCLHPGGVATTVAAEYYTGPLEWLVNRLSHGVLLTPVEGAVTSVYLAASPAARSLNGAYVVRCRPRKLSRLARDTTSARRLWEVSERLVAETAR